MDEKILYLDCASGISGDMTVGALLDLGASREKLVRALDSLGVSGYHLHFGRTKKCGIDAYDFDVHLEEEEHHHDHEHSHDEHNHSHDEHDHSHDEYDHEHHHDHEHTHDHEHHHAHEHTHEHEHSHDHAHTHDHMHPHVHRNIHDIFEIIDRLDASDRVKNLARRMFEIVAGAESKAHGIPVSEVHFHEVGAIDSIVDVISAAFCLEDLGIHRVVVSPLSEGHGFARCQHGLMPVPVPATANIAAAQGLELTLRDVEGEMVTPTGAAIAAAFRTEAALPKKYQIEKIGIGAGNKDFAHANILRAMLLTDQNGGSRNRKRRSRRELHVGHGGKPGRLHRRGAGICDGGASGSGRQRCVVHTGIYEEKPSGVCASCTDNGRKTGRIRTACLLLYDHDRCAPLSSREDDTATGSKGDPDPLRGSKGKNLQARRRGYVLSGV